MNRSFIYLFIRFVSVIYRMPSVVVVVLSQTDWTEARATRSRWSIKKRLPEANQRSIAVDNYSTITPVESLIPLAQIEDSWDFDRHERVRASPLEQNSWRRMELKEYKSLLLFSSNIILRRMCISSSYKSINNYQTSAINSLASIQTRRRTYSNHGN